MNRLLPKLVSVSILLVISLMLVVISTYAWVTMSGSPEVGGIKITIGGLDTILIAPDIKEQAGESVLHYPGAFSDKVDFTREDGYDYLGNIVGLTPYSTADGVHWFGSAYAAAADSQDGVIGQLLSLDKLPMDATLANANLTELPEDGSLSGCYVTLDFWVVSPMEDCKLRVSAGDSENGSFVMDLKSVLSKDDKYVLAQDEQLLSASVRVGFLANEDKIDDGSMERYVNSKNYSDKFRHLCGIYQEPGQPYFRTAGFTIYEPNGDFHGKDLSYTHTEKGISSKTYESGSYVITKPIGFADGKAMLTDVSSILTVQKLSSWRKTPEGEDLIDQVFHAYAMTNSRETDTAILANGFYGDYLQHQLGAYMTSGRFIKNTEDLYKAATGDTVVADALDELAVAGTTDTAVIVNLQKNVPQKIRMCIWIEGQDVDCVNGAAANHFTMNIELAGSSD